MNGPEGEPDAGTEQFSHDAIGNRVQEHRFLSDPQNPDNGIRNYTVSLTGQVSQITSDASIQSAFYSQENYEYDNAGNTIHDYGNERRSSGSPTYNNYWESRSYYGADEKLRVYSRFAGIGPNSDPAMAGHRAVYEETWYDALGRRVMVRSRRDANCGSLPVFPDDCVSSLQRYVWDGDQVLYEIRTDGSDSTTWDAMSLNSPSTLRNLPFNAYGVVGYTHITGIDVPSLIFKSTTSAGLQVLVPHVNWRGVFDSANVVSGAVPSVRWPGRTETLDAAPATANALYDWFGDLSGGNTTGSGQKYMRNRYYDPTTGKFTQEDPIGLAGGLNAYGFASGDPVNFGDPFGLCSTPPDSILVTVTVECGDGTTGTRQVWAHRVTDPQTLDNYAVSANGITMDAEDDYDPALLGETGELILGALGAVYEIPERVDAYHVATAGGVPRGETSTMFLRSDVLRNIRNGSYGAFIQGNPRLQTCQIVFHEGLHMWFNSKGFFGPDDDHPMINPLVARTRC